jgi:hypothetical protein
MSVQKLINTARAMVTEGKGLLAMETDRYHANFSIA